MSYKIRLAPKQLSDAYIEKYEIVQELKKTNDKKLVNDLKKVNNKLHYLKKFYKWGNK